MIIFVDTWGFKSLIDSKDKNHNEVNELFTSLWENNVKLLTSDYILDETFTLLSIASNIKTVKLFSESINNAEEKKILEIEWIGKKIFYEALQMKLKFKDKPKISFTDFTSMAVMRMNNIKHVITGDNHFKSVNLGLIPILNKHDI
jgi:uncharacterized protein